MIDVRVGVSSALNGSSSSSTSGSSANARARLTRCASPPDSVRDDRSRQPADAESREPALRALSPLAARDAAQPQPRLDVVECRAVEQQRLLEDDRHTPPELQFAPARRLALEQHGPDVGRSSSASWRSNVVLPAPLGPMIASTSPARTSSEGTSTMVRALRRTARPCTLSFGASGSATGARSAALRVHRAHHTRPGRGAYRTAPT